MKKKCSAYKYCEAAWEIERLRATLRDIHDHPDGARVKAAEALDSVERTKLSSADMCGTDGRGGGTACGQSRSTVGLEDETKLRYLLFAGHHHDKYPLCLYGDDGEMQCSVCHCDFVRDSPDVLLEKMDRWGMQELVRAGIVKVCSNK